MLKFFLCNCYCFKFISSNKYVQIRKKNIKEQWYTQHVFTFQHIVLAISALIYHNHQFTYSQQIKNTILILSCNMWNFIKLSYFKWIIMFEQVSDICENIHIIKNYD